MIKNKIIFFIALVISTINGQQLYSQSSNYIYIDRFEKKDVDSKTHKSWSTYSDAKSGGGSEGKINFIGDPSHKTKELSFSYYLLKKNWSYPPYAGLSCYVESTIFSGITPIGIAYDFKGKKHTFNYLTNGVIDNSYYKKNINESKEWTSVFIPFSDLKQDSWTTSKTAFDYLDISGLTWAVNGSDKDTGVIYIDNLRFVLSDKKNVENQEVSTTNNYIYIEDSIAKNVFTKHHDSLFYDVIAYTNKAKTYHESIKKIKSIEKTIDSLNTIINQSSSLSDKRKGEFNKLLKLAFNNKPQDIHGRINVMDKKSLKILKGLIDIERLYKMDMDYWKEFNSVSTMNIWAEGIWNFSATRQIDYFSTPDSIFEKEIKKYNIQPNQTIAEIGAGSCFFEQALSLYCNNIKVYVNEIDENRIHNIKAKLKFLESHDDKDIHYTAVLGTDTSTGLPADNLDMIVIKNTFHHFSSPDKMLIDINKSLKNNGRLFITDIMRDEVEKAACPQHMKRAEFLSYFKNNGFVLVNESPLGYGQDRFFEFRKKLSEPGF